MSDQGKANYEAYRDFSHGKSLVSGTPIPAWDGLPHEIQAAWNAGADAVEQWLAECPADEDAPGSEPASEVRPGHEDCCTTGNAAAARKLIEDGLDEIIYAPGEAHHSLLAGIGYALLAVHGVLDRAVALAAEDADL